MRENVILPASIVLALMLHTIVLLTGIQQQSTPQHHPVRIAVRLAAPAKQIIKDTPVAEVPRATTAQSDSRAVPLVAEAGLQRAKVERVEPEQAKTTVPSPAIREPYVTAKPPQDPAMINTPLATLPTPEPVMKSQSDTGANASTHDAAHSVDENLLRDEYLAKVSAHLQQHKIYPMLARRRGLEGEATLRINIGDQGQIVAYDLEKSSGHDLLDQAVRAMIENVGSFPAPPEPVVGGFLQCRIPICFNLRAG
jgi:TonB family protein